MTPEFIGSRLLLKMRRMAEKQLGVLVQKAVISVPAEFDERQRNFTVRAANLAGQLSAVIIMTSDVMSVYQHACYFILSQAWRSYV